MVPEKQIIRKMMMVILTRQQSSSSSSSSSSPPPPPPSIALTYNRGIKLDHVMASASVPVNYDYALVPIDSSDSSKGNRRFWDGGVLSNTPLRELIQAHEDYWNVKRTERVC